MKFHEAPNKKGVGTISQSSRNVTIAGHRTSVRLEDEIWEGLDEICRRESLSLAELCTMIERRRRGASRTSAIRVFILTYFRAAATDDGHVDAGHGVLSSERKGAGLRKTAE